MRENILATIELAPGSVGWYDSLTGIHLSLTKKRFFITNDIDKNKLTNVRKAVKEGKLIIIAGSQNLMCDSVSIIDNPTVYEMPKEEPTLTKEEIVETFQKRLRETFEKIDFSSIEEPEIEPEIVQEIKGEIEEISIKIDLNENKKTKKDKKKNKK